MQKLKRLDDLLEYDAQRIDEQRHRDRPSDLQMQIDATQEEIRRAFQGENENRTRIRAKLTDNA